MRSQLYAIWVCLSLFPQIGIQMMFLPPESCQLGLYPPATECFFDYCHNGGTCIKDDWGEISCTCPPEFPGPRCQSTHHSFDGESYALYEPLEHCENGRTSLSIITTQENGLILYNGPTTDRAPDSEEPTDFISLELSAGYPRLRIDHGSGPLELYVDGRGSDGAIVLPKLNDGKWHRLDIVTQGPTVELIVDHCNAAKLEAGSRVHDDTMCRVTRRRGDDRILNVSTVLQMGGRFSQPQYPSNITMTNFNGCIKYVVHNSKLYDLTVPSDTSYRSGENRCTREDVICGANSPDGLLCGDNGICASSWEPDVATCNCKPGYKGYKCGENVTTKDLDKDSFMQWRLKDSFSNGLSVYTMKMNVMFRTRDTEGALWTVSNLAGDFIKLQVLGGRLTLTYNLGDGIRNLELYNRFVSNGAWHTTTVDRNGREFILKMDNGEGPNFNFTYGLPNDKQEMQIENTVFGGANVSFVDSVPVLSSDLTKTCIQDIRMNNEWFPMEISDGSSKAAILSKATNVGLGCTRDDCKPGVCVSTLSCYPLWGDYDCRCPEHYEKYDFLCMPIYYCDNHRCAGDSRCEIDYEDKKNYVCICPRGWEGEFCGSLEPTSTLGAVSEGHVNMSLDALLTTFYAYMSIRFLVI